MSSISQIMSAYCREKSIESGLLASHRRTGLIVSHRTAFVALVLKINHPQALKNIYQNNPNGLVLELTKYLGPGKSGLSKLLKNARFYYKTYAEFKNEVDNLERKINAAGN